MPNNPEFWLLVLDTYNQAHRWADGCGECPPCRLLGTADELMALGPNAKGGS